jgi:WD40 repeat protein
LGAYGKEKKETKEYTYKLKGKSKCISLGWDDEHQQLLTGNESGNIAVWSPESGKCDYVFNAHIKTVTSMNWNNTLRRLITASSDGKIKVWKLPVTWMNLGDLLKKTKKKVRVEGLY